MAVGVFSTGRRAIENARTVDRVADKTRLALYAIAGIGYAFAAFSFIRTYQTTVTVFVVLAVWLTAAFKLTGNYVTPLVHAAIIIY